MVEVDREHSFEIANVKNMCVKIKKGDTNTWNTWPEKPEPWNPSAALFCGFGHHGMKGKIVIH